MSREQKIEKARALKAQGLSYGEVAERVGVHKKTIRRWLVPGEAERDRQTSLAWKHRNKGWLREYDAGYREAHMGECSSCGGEMDPKWDGGICMACREEEKDRRARQIERWWGEGLRLPDIADLLGWSREHLAVEFHRLREQGYDLPYRYRLSEPRFPEQVAA